VINERLQFVARRLKGEPLSDLCRHSPPLSPFLPIGFPLRLTLLRNHPRFPRCDPTAAAEARLRRRRATIR
jgi:hypothetical protein